MTSPLHPPTYTIYSTISKISYYLFLACSVFASGPRLPLQCLTNHLLEMILTNWASPSTMSGRPVTCMSRIVWIVVNLLPVTTNKGFKKANFKLFSLKTLFFCLFFIGPFVAVNTVAISTGVVSEAFMQMNIINNIISQGSLLATCAALGCQSLSPFLVSSDIPAVSTIALAQDLRWPKYGLMVVLANVLTLVGQFFGKYPFEPRISLFFCIPYFLFVSFLFS